MMRKNSIIFYLGVMIISAVAFVGKSHALESKIISEPKPLVKFKLFDQNNKIYENASLEGKWTLVLFGYTHCPDVCPFTLDNLVSVIEHLSQKTSPSSLPTVLFVGVDPERDAPNLKEYVAHFRDDFTGATGEWSELKKLIENLEGFARLYKKGKEDNAYVVRHSSYIYVIDPDGKYHARMNPPLEPTRTSEFLATLIRKYRISKARRGD